MKPKAEYLRCFGRGFGRKGKELQLQMKVSQSIALVFAFVLSVCTQAQDLGSPTTIDTDKDGLYDNLEVNTHKTDPNVADTDEDGLTDGEEIYDYNTNPLLKDSDGDGLLDGQELNEHKSKASLGSAAWAGDKTILFLDDDAILYRSGTRRVLQQPRRHADNPVIAETKAWEVAIGYCTVYRDIKTGLHQCWYQSYSGNHANDPTRRVVVCYATSNDGVVWEKPNLGLFDYNGDHNTNIVLVGNGGRSVNYGASVLVDHRDSDTEKRYKMAYWDFVNVAGRQVPGLCVAFSRDGIHWVKHSKAPLLQGAYGDPTQPPLSAGSQGEPPTRPAISDVIDLMWDSRRDSFVIYSKTWIDAPDGRRFWKRAIIRTESKDFIHWSMPQLIIVPDDGDSGQIHGASVFYLHGVYLATLQRLDLGGFDRGGTGNMPAELALSRDGINWNRSFQDEMFLPVTGDGETFDAGCLWTSSTPIYLPEEIRFYYGAYPGWNSDLENDSTGIGLAILPRDRFAAIEPTDAIAQVTLKSIQLRNVKRVTINADATDGDVRVELLTAEGYRVAGYTRDQSVIITGNSFRHPVNWEGKMVADLAAGRYQLRLHLKNARLFALTIQR